MVFLDRVKKNREHVSSIFLETKPRIRIKISLLLDFVSKKPLGGAFWIFFAEFSNKAWKALV